MGAALTLGVAAQVRQAPGKGRQSPPAAFQRTINQQAFGGEILDVKREDKRHGRWNNEIVVRTSSKD